MKKTKFYLIFISILVFLINIEQMYSYKKYTMIIITLTTDSLGQQFRYFIRIRIICSIKIVDNIYKKR